MSGWYLDYVSFFFLGSNFFKAGTCLTLRILMYDIPKEITSSITEKDPEYAKYVNPSGFIVFP